MPIFFLQHTKNLKKQPWSRGMEILTRHRNYKLSLKISLNIVYGKSSYLQNFSASDVRSKCFKHLTFYLRISQTMPYAYVIFKYGSVQKVWYLDFTTRK